MSLRRRRAAAGLSRTPILAWVLAAALVPGCLAACGQPHARSAAPTVLRLGALLPLSGASAPTGEWMVPAAKLAVKEANDAGGVLGHRVELVVRDDSCDPETAVVKANELVAMNVTASVGGFCSSATVPTLKVFHSGGVPMIIPAANSTDLLSPGFDGVFLLNGTTSIEARRAISWMRPLGTRRLALVDDGTSFSSAITRAAVQVVKAPGNTLRLAATLRLSQGAPTYPRIVAAVLASHADMVFYTSYYPEAGKLIRDLRAAHYTGKIMLSDGGTDPALFDNLTAAQAEGVYGVALPMAEFDPKVAAWAARYRKIAGKEPGPFTMQAYDAVRLALDAVRRAGTLDRKAVRKAIAATVPADLHLLSGPSRFNPDGTQVDPTFILLRAHRGAFTLASPEGRS